MQKERKQDRFNFNFNFYGTRYSTVNVTTNGFLNFGSSSTTYTNRPIPVSATPNASIAPFWDDLQVSGAQAIYYKQGGLPPIGTLWSNGTAFLTLTIRPIPLPSRQCSMKMAVFCSNDWGTIPFNKGDTGLLVAFTSGIGDGDYPVYGLYDGEKIVGIIIDLLPEDDKDS